MPSVCMMAKWEFDYLRVACPRELPGQEQVLNIFQIITPPSSQFRPTRIWSREPQKKKSPCLWCVLYTTQDNQIEDLPGNQAKELRNQLQQFTPPNASIVDYEFHQGDAYNDQEWVMVWRVRCKHVTNFYKLDETHEEQLLGSRMGRIS